YCSSLYPKFERYSTCNWCLSEDGVKSAAQESTMDQHRSLSFSSNSTGRGLTVKLHGGASSQHLKKVLNKPVKKLQTHAHERLQLPALSKTTRLDLPLPSLRKQKQAFRCRARKFKLLEEVLTQTEQNTPNHYVMCMRSSCKQKPQTLLPEGRGKGVCGITAEPSLRQDAYVEQATEFSPLTMLCVSIHLLVGLQKPVDYLEGFCFFEHDKLRL
ncbi:hypothetical protein GW17_00008329, partial [Ensete ventricosum]